MICVITVPTQYAALALLPPTDLIGESPTRTYFFYDASGDDLAFHDTDGSLLIESRHFATLADATDWARADAAAA